MTLVKTYTEDGYQEIPEVRLSDDEYGRGLQCFVPACTDIVPVDLSSKTIYLARRATKPMTGWWWIGGRMSPNETKESAVLRNLKRETGLELTSDRLRLVAVFDYLWKDRQQMPQEIGCHMLGFTFVAHLSSKEIDTVTNGLERVEYDISTGLVAFTRDKLVEENVFPAILDLYDHVFMQQESVV